MTIAGVGIVNGSLSVTVIDGRNIDKRLACAPPGCAWTVHPEVWISLCQGSELCMTPEQAEVAAVLLARMYPVTVLADLQRAEAKL